MRRAVLLILGLCFLTSITRPGFSEKPLRLFFEKNIDVEDEPAEEHTVRQGEWLFKILQDKGYSATQIQRIMPGVQALNPHIPDLSRLKPGQVLRIPEGVPAAPQQPALPVADVPADSYERRAYVVQSGDTLVEILQHQGVPTSLIFGKYMNLFLELNPSVPDTNTLRAGQEIILPVLTDAAGPDAAPAEAPPAPQPQEEEVREAEKTPDIPVTLIPVPVSPDTRAEPAPKPTGAPGQGMPGRPSGETSSRAVPAAPAAPAAPVAPPEVAPQPPAEPERSHATNATANATAPADTRTPQTGLPFVRTVLKEMRFGFMPGDESMFPLPGSGGWLHVKLFETPLAETPWGDRILFCPVPKSADWIANANKLGMKIATISPRWSLQEILDKMAQTFPGRFRLWSAERELVLTRSGIGLTLQSPQMAIVDTGDKKTVHMVWARRTPNETPLPQGLHEVLEEAQVRVIELDAYNELSRLPARPKDSIYVPVATHMDLIQAINPRDPEAFFGRNLPADLNSLLQLLRSTEALQQGMASASWTNGPGNRIGLQVPAWIVTGGTARVILLDRRFADPYLVSVLSREGYTCFVLPD